MAVTFLDLKSQYRSIKNEIDEAISSVVESCAFAGGPFVEKFEKNWAAFCGCDHSVGVGSGTEALWVALLALGVGPGDEVITVPNTFIATAEAISFSGAEPVFVDIDESTYNMDPQKLNEFLKGRCAFNSESRILKNTATGRRIRAIIPVHLYGMMADMGPIMDSAREYGLAVIEDASQAHGASYNGKTAGSIGHAGCFSFYPGKNLGAYGEAGAVVTNDRELAEKIRILRDHGQPSKYIHSAIGWNSRMDGIQGAVLDVKLKHIKSWNDNRRWAASTYNENLAGIEDMVLPVEITNCDHVYHIYAARTEQRDELIEFLKERNIFCGIHYPIPIHLQEAYKYMGLEKGSFPVAEKCSEQVFSLPMFPEITNDQIQEVCQTIKDFYAKIF